jgi:hypothetical protein
MTAHPHAANQSAGSKYDRKLRTDVTGNTGGIGHHFPPMVHNAPVHGMTVAHDVVECPSCFAGVLWNRAPVSFICQGCGAIIDGSTLAGQ